MVCTCANRYWQNREPGMPMRVRQMWYEGGSRNLIICEWVTRRRPVAAEKKGD